MADLPAYQRGNIVIVREFRDQQGRNEKHPPCLILDLMPGNEYYVVAITSQFQTVLQLDEILLPFANPPQRSASGLTKKSIAKLSWVSVVRESMIEEKCGYLSTKTFRSVVDQFTRFHQREHMAESESQN